ncbi:putative 2-dehydro-3-deoxygalactonokinase protein [Neobacillus bataviensis LMG 21833]|uniref:Putative 2-dehydro-3-deoxygalactonokinase protein n=1 Tax=Neobacillus bataviensis LMG 21833 TaxID=1117379 RepID=K6CD72_9BACI|nr:2-dehydro-3-deoxygalactonokinase [Neobacillus bataviensis]EKN69060.1 putative 2-dehydro-3-deoxygalactonokinase protein [Neobacillus bataviensis LMG 21833]
MKVILIDSGTTNSRLRLYDKTTSEVLDTEKIRIGVKDTAISGSNNNLKAQLKQGLERLLAKHQLTPSDIEYIAASGMITSNLGIYEIPHIPSPAGLEEFAQFSKVTQLEEFLSIPCVFIPGMKNTIDSMDPRDLVACINEFDVMRGEEVESFGLLKQFDVNGKGMIVLPGSHTKFVAVGERKDLLYCLSTLGGETLSALQKETILSDSLGSSLIKSIDQKMLECGFEAAKQYGLTRSFYHIRLLDLFSDLDANQRANYFAGSVIYSDLQALSQSEEGMGEIEWMIVGGSDPLRKAFSHLLSYMNKKWDVMEATDQQVEDSLVFGASEILANCKDLFLKNASKGSVCDENSQL